MYGEAMRFVMWKRPQSQVVPVLRPETDSQYFVINHNGKEYEKVNKITFVVPILKIRKQRLREARDLPKITQLLMAELGFKPKNSLYVYFHNLCSFYYTTLGENKFMET